MSSAKRTMHSNGNGTNKAAKLSSSNGHSNGKSTSHVDEVITFLRSVCEMTLEEGFSNQVKKRTAVVNFKAPKELEKIFDFNVDDTAVNHEALLSICQKVFDYSVKTGHPHFFNQLYAGVDAYGFAGSIISDVLNSSVYTYEVTPVFVVMEKSVIKQVCDIIGYENGDGTMCPGGSYSNMLGLNVARYKKFPDVKEVGMRNMPRMVIFSSEQSHYSNKKNASLMGIGSNDVIAVKSDESGRMDLNDLQRCIDQTIAQGDVPLCVVATSGTTILGAYDPLHGIADICVKHDIWLHVDASWGGGALFSRKHRHLLDGIERTDSVAWNMHKMAMAPLQCCFFVTKHAELLSGAHTLHVPYLFQTDKTLYDASYDIGKKVIQCGRKIDIFKFWLMWKALGREGMEARINKAFDNSRYLTNLVKNREGFRLVQEPECTNVCFWFIPERMRSMEFDLEDEHFCKQLNAVAPQIKEKMTIEGVMLVGYNPLHNLPNFFRMVVINDQVGYQDMDHVVSTIQNLGTNL